MRAIDAIRNNKRHTRSGVTRLAPILAAALACTTATNAAMIFGPPQRPATAYTWTGAADSNWGNAANWSPPNPPPPPRSKDTVTITAPAATQPPNAPPGWNVADQRWDITVNVGNQKVSDITVNSNTHLTVDNGITVNQNVTVNADVTLKSSQNATRVLDVKKNLSVGQTADGSITIQDNAKLKIRGNVQVGDGNPGTINVNDKGKLQINGDLQIGGPGVGTVNINKAKDGDVDVKGKTIVGAANPAGAAQGGTLNVADGAIFKARDDVTVGQGPGNGSVSIGDGAEINAAGHDVNIGGNGTVRGAGGQNGSKIRARKITSSGKIIAEGLFNLNADVDLLDGSDLQYAIDGLDDYGSLKISGHLNLAGALILDIGGGFVPTPGNTFRLINAGSINGQFNGIPDNGQVTFDGYTFKIRYKANDVSSLVFAKAIPSTGAGALAAIGLGLIVIRRTRAG